MLQTAKHDTALGGHWSGADLHRIQRTEEAQRLKTRKESGRRLKTGTEEARHLQAGTEGSPGGSWLWQEGISCSRLERKNLGDWGRILGLALGLDLLARAEGAQCLQAGTERSRRLQALKEGVRRLQVETEELGGSRFRLRELGGCSLRRRELSGSILE